MKHLLLVLFILSNLSIFSQTIDCEGEYPLHLQGLDRDKSGNIYWSFTDKIVKTDSKGQLLVSIDAPSHQGGLTIANDKIYIAVNLGKFNEESGADSWIFVYNPSDLSLADKIEVQDVRFGAGGMAYNPDKNVFVVIGGLPTGYDSNYIYIYTPEFTLKKKVELKTGYTKYGIQTAYYSDKTYFFGCYGSPAVTIKANNKLNKFEIIEEDTSLGITKISGRYYKGLWSGAEKKGSITPTSLLDN